MDDVKIRQFGTGWFKIRRKGIMSITSPLVKEKPKYWQPFLIALAMAVVVFAPFVIMDHGYFLFYGDFNVQQIPFYQMCHDAVRSGNIFWNWTTDLGVNFIGSYSFYLLGSPFFWLTIPFPSHIVPYLFPFVNSFLNYS